MHSSVIYKFAADDAKVFPLYSTTSCTICILCLTHALFAFCLAKQSFFKHLRVFETHRD